SDAEAGEPSSTEWHLSRNDRPQVRTPDGFVLRRTGGYSEKSIRTMIKALQSELSINVIASIIVSLLFLAAGFIWGKYKERRRKFGRNLEEYDFYPFTVSRENFGEFSLKDFRLGMHYFLKNEDYTAARQLIFIGEQ